MLFEDLYKIQEFSESPEDKSLHAAIVLNIEHDIFKGHFPGNPVLPGVCQIEILSELISRYCKKTMALTKVKSIKFLTLVNPLTSSQLQFDIQMTGNENILQVKANASIQNGDICFKFNGTFNEVQG